MTKSIPQDTSHVFNRRSTERECTDRKNRIGHVASRRNSVILQRTPCGTHRSLSLFCYRYVNLRRDQTSICKVVRKNSRISRNFSFRGYQRGDWRYQCVFFVLSRSLPRCFLDSDSCFTSCFPYWLQSRNRCLPSVRILQLLGQKRLQRSHFITCFLLLLQKSCSNATASTRDTVSSTNVYWDS